MQKNYNPPPPSLKKNVFRATQKVGRVLFCCWPLFYFYFKCRRMRGKGPSDFAMEILAILSNATVGLLMLI